MIETIAQELNARASAYKVGDLQEIRKDLKSLLRRPGLDLFKDSTIHAEWAFHYGGRKELQFNIGYDGSGGSELRHGVAFSFETSQTLPTIDVLKPKVRLFNEFLRLYPDEYADMRMWHWEDETCSPRQMPGAIAPELVREGVFLFMGNFSPLSDELDYDKILLDFDRLLPLYRYVESGGKLQPAMMSGVPFSFIPGCTAKACATTGTYSDRELDINLRHNVLQQMLYRRLVANFGEENVGTELASGVGTSVDVVVRRPEGYWYYEIKTAHSPRACIREAIGQLLEYSFWPGGQEAVRLIIVGESPLDGDAADYLRRLNARSSIRLEYEQITI